MKNTEITKFKLTDEEAMEVEERLKSLLEICQIHHIPMFASVAIENSEEGTVYNNIVYSGQAHKINLKEDYIRKCILVADGFEAVPARDSVSFDMEEVFGDEGENR